MKTHENSLFDQVQVQECHLKNRLVVSPMTRRSATTQGVPTPEMVNYYMAFAAGGFGMIITEGTYTADVHSQALDNQPGITNKQQQEGWQEVVASVHQHGALIINQLMHRGALGQISEQNIAPSAVQPAGVKYIEPGESAGAYPIPMAMSADGAIFC